MGPCRERIETRRLGVAAIAACLATVLVLLLSSGSGHAAGAPVTVTDYTSPEQALAWGYRSHWKQPWRSYLDTVPAVRLLDAIGINFNVKAAWAGSTARLLGENGFRRARIEVPWGNLEYDDPEEMTDRTRSDLETTLTALQANGIRPLIVLNANHGKPCPIEEGTVVLTAPAQAGDKAIHVALESLDKIVPGRTGIRSGGVAAQYLFTSVEPDGTVHLSAPLGSLPAATLDQPTVGALPAGPLAVETLRYEPFGPSTLAGGAPNPRAEATLQGWLDYVGVVTREARAILGSADFDVEVWNELGFGSRFLNLNGYYSPPLEWRSGGVGADQDWILERTVEYLRNPLRGLAGVGIGDGFASQTPWPSGATSPVGLTAIDKHPYSGSYSFPLWAAVNGNRPLDGLGQPAGWSNAAGWHETFTPTYYAFFPEYFLAGIQPETLVNDLAPYSTNIQGTEHGRETHPPGGAGPALWITELNLEPESGPTEDGSMSAADVRHVETKIVLRSLAAYVNKGVAALDFYAARAGNYSLVDRSFFDAVGAHPTLYPGRSRGGETIDAVRRLAVSMHGAEPISSPRSLSLQSLTDYSGNVQFEGNGTAAYPPLHNRDVFAFLPFQVTEDRFVVPVYVMTRNVVEESNPGDTGPTRFDLPAEPYRLDIGGVDGEDATVTATDPLTGEAVPVKAISGSAHDLVVELGVTDSPRLLTIQEHLPRPGPGPGGGGGGGGNGGGGGADGKDGPFLWLRIVDGRDLLQPRGLVAIVRCEEACDPEIEGSLSVGQRSFPLRPLRQGRRETDRRLTVRLGVGAGAAHVADAAFEHGRRIRAVVQASASLPGSGEMETRRRSVLLAGPPPER